MTTSGCTEWIATMPGVIKSGVSKAPTAVSALLSVWSRINGTKR